ncbi:hypothetical protein FHR24_003118 [Wenyingzhuangia heitensis]|uniref:6-bladed beta-propeller protein n=1 Tax=Wenyingzhuangia heitensis TaxID=1487859 RepID=A0ABX0UDW8_9FLAO|nr:6-bladed beta-propeller [Wenyingzhuangia heitensis]NIJ46623.1 hypothetical protein [Wenyingzhuangia heitensis]
MNKVLLLLLLLLFSCGLKEKNDKNKLRSINIKGSPKYISKNKIKEFDVEKEFKEKIIIPSDAFNDYINLFDLALSIEIIPLETKKESLFASATKVIVHSGDYYIHDIRNNRLLRFNKNGGFLNKIGTIGRGPEEVSSISDISIDKKNNLISILDLRSRFIIRYDEFGSYKDLKPLYCAVSNHEYLGNKIIFGVNKGVRNKHYSSIDRYSLIWGNENFNPEKKAFKNPEIVNNLTLPTSLKRINGRVFYNKAFSNKIWEIKKDKLIPILQVEYETNGLSEGFWKEKSNIEEIKKIMKEKIILTGNFIDSKHFYCFSAHFNGEISEFYYNKKNKSLIYGLTSSFTKGKNVNSLFFNPFYYKKGVFYSILKAELLTEILKANKNNKQLIKIIGEKKFKSLLDLNILDNSVIVKFKLKDFDER